MTGDGRIDYEQLTQDAMRSIVRTVLHRTAKAGLPGEHHFYISFDTRSRGVLLSRRLKEKYPEEMTIVLQHRFADLLVSDDRFEVKLTFDGIPERLVVPFLAIKVFFDPSVHFGLQFESMDSIGGDDVETIGGGGSRSASATTRLSGAAGSKSRLAGERKPKSSRRGKAGQDETLEPVDAEAARRERLLASMPTADNVEPIGIEPVAAGETPPAAVEPAAVPTGGAEIVRLDQFRKK